MKVILPLPDMMGRINTTNRAGITATYVAPGGLAVVGKVRILFR
jgi:hypothetical protein